LVVFPIASRLFVTCRVSFGIPLMTATPPALSVIGPNESNEIIIPAVESILVTATATPYRPEVE
jgi:hypothetical protein